MSQQSRQSAHPSHRDTLTWAILQSRLFSRRTLDCVSLVDSKASWPSATLQCVSSILFLLSHNTQHRRLSPTKDFSFQSRMHGNSESSSTTISPCPVRLLEWSAYVLYILLCDKTMLGLKLLSFCSGRSIRFIHLTSFSKPSSLLKGAPLQKTLSQLCLEALDYFGSSRWCFPRLTPLFRKRCGTSLRELIQTDNPFSPRYS